MKVADWWEGVSSLGRVQLVLAVPVSRFHSCFYLLVDWSDLFVGSTKSNFSHTLFIFLKVGQNLSKQWKCNSFSHFNIPEVWTDSFSSPVQSILPLLLHPSRLDVWYTRVTEKIFWLENVLTIKFLRDGSFIVRKIEREDGMKWSRNIHFPGYQKLSFLRELRD